MKGDLVQRERFRCRLEPVSDAPMISDSSETGLLKAPIFSISMITESPERR